MLKFISVQEEAVQILPTDWREMLDRTDGCHDPEEQVIN